MTAPNQSKKGEFRPIPNSGAGSVVGVSFDPRAAHAEVRALPNTRTALNGVPWLPSNAFPLQRLDGRPNLQQGVTLRLILTGLMENGAKLSSGRVVDGPMDAINFLLERAAEEIGVTKTGDFPGKFVTPR